MREMLRLFALMMGAHWLWMAVGAVFALITVLFNIGLLTLSGWFIAAMAVAGVASQPINYFTPAAAIRGFAIFRTVGRYLERLSTHEATFRLLANIRVWFFTKLEPLAPAALSQAHSGDLFNRIRGDIDILDHFYLRILIPYFVAVIGGVVAVTALALVHPVAAILVSTILLVAGLVLPYLSHMLGRTVGARMTQTRAEMSEAVVDLVQGLEELEAYGAAQERMEALAARSDRWQGDLGRMAHITGLGTAAVGLSASLALWVAVLMVIPAVRDGELSGPMLALVAMLVLGMFELIGPLPLAMQYWGQTRAAAQRLFEIADHPIPIKDPEHGQLLEKNGAVDLEIRDLKLRYHPDGPYALQGLDLSLPQGKKIAVIGPSGSGKTSILNALLRFWEYEGEVRLAGHSLRDYAASEVRAVMSVLAQDSHLFNATLAENLALANPSVTDDLMWTALAQAHVADVVRAHGQGLELSLGEGAVGLSGGQTRRLMLARAQLAAAPIVLLDEPTEGLDPIGEKNLMADLIPMLTGKSVLLITHKAIGLSAMDEIVILDQGRVRARGRHQELLATDAGYRSFVSRLDETVA